MGYNKIPRISFNCDFCSKPNTSKASAFRRKKRHFCNTVCYSAYRREIMLPYEHNSWKGGITPNEVRKRWIARHRENYSFLRHKEYLRRHKNVVGNHTLDEWMFLLEKFGRKCAYCKQEKKLTKDHIIPLALGGTNYISNIQPLCGSCNSRKWIKTNIHENPELLK